MGLRVIAIDTGDEKKKLCLEELGSEAFVDFANQDLHIHCVIPSATQEEVLFSCCPEAFVGAVHSIQPII